MQRCAGFTLIEILVVLTVLGIVLAFGVPSYSAFIQNGHIRSVSESIVDGLNLARMEAVNRNERVEFNLDGANWTIDVPASGERVHNHSGAGSAGTVSVSAAGSQSLSIAFNALGRITSGNAATVVTIGTQVGECMPLGAMRCLRVQLSTSGRVRMCDPNLQANDPQACA